MKYLKPHSKFSAVSPMATPNVSVVFDRAALEQAKYLVQEVSTECQWFHRVERIEDANSITFYIYDMIVPDQEVSATFVESSDNEMVAMSDEIMNRLGGEDKVLESDELINEFNTLTNTFSVWCHSHVNMGTSPSGTDQTEFGDRIKNASDAGVVHPQIMFILNKKGDYTCHIADMDSGWVFKNPDVIVSNADIDFSYIDSAIKTKLRKKKTPVFVTTGKWSKSGASGVSGHWATGREPSGVSNCGASGWHAPRDSKGRFVSHTGGPPQGNALAATEAALMMDYLDGPTTSLTGSFDPESLVKLSPSQGEEIMRLCKECDSAANISKRNAIAEKISDVVVNHIGLSPMAYLNTMLFADYRLAASQVYKDFVSGGPQHKIQFIDDLVELPFDHTMLVDLIDDIMIIKSYPTSFDDQHKSMLDEYFYVGE
jgi:hypothetical protein